MKPEDAQRRLAEVLHILEQAALPADLRPVAFQCLWNSLSEVPAETSTPEPATELATDRTASLAKRLGVDRGAVADIYGQDDEGTLVPKVPSASLNQAKLAATQELALLVCAGRQVGGEASTSNKVIKQVCDEHGKLDKANFAKALKAGDNYWMTTGTGQSKMLKLRQPGWEAAAELVKRIQAHTDRK